jgi:hypothetical protein
MSKTLLSLILLGLSGLASANEVPASPAPQQMLDKRKAIESDSHRSRIRILQEAEGCIQAAKTPQDYRACEQKERQAREQLREELRPRHQALRQEARQWRQSRQAEGTSAKP